MKARGDIITAPFVPPPIMPGLDYIIRVFWELSNDRSVGFGAGPIPAASIDRVARDEGMNRDDRAVFRLFIRTMDAVYLEDANATDADGKPIPKIQAPMPKGEFGRMMRNAKK